MFKFKTKSPALFPKIDKIRDEAIKEFGKDLATVIVQTIRDILDDLKMLEKIERVTSLPSASKDVAYKFYLVEGTGSASDTLHICIDTGNGNYAFRQITLT